MKRSIEIMLDDLDGRETGPGGQTVSFALDGVAYAIDLNARNAKVLREVMLPYIDAGTRLGAVGKADRQPGPARGAVRAEIAARKQERVDVAAWLLQQRGITVAVRGRLKQEYYAEYQAWKHQQTMAAITGTAMPVPPEQRRPLKSVPPATFASAKAPVKAPAAAVKSAAVKAAAAKAAAAKATRSPVRRRTASA